MDGSAPNPTIAHPLPSPDINPDVGLSAKFLVPNVFAWCIGMQVRVHVWCMLSSLGCRWISCHGAAAPFPFYRERLPDNVGVSLRLVEMVREYVDVIRLCGKWFPGWNLMAQDSALFSASVLVVVVEVVVLIWFFRFFPLGLNLSLLHVLFRWPSLSISPNSCFSPMRPPWCFVCFLRASG